MILPNERPKIEIYTTKWIPTIYEWELSDGTVYFVKMRSPSKDITEEYIYRTKEEMISKVLSIFDAQLGEN